MPPFFVCILSVLKGVCVCVCVVSSEPDFPSCAIAHLQLLFLIAQKFSNGLNLDCLGFLAQEPFRILIFL